MVLERFLQWTAEAPAQARADAARALVNACGHVGADRRRADHLDRMLSALLNDPSVMVRCALAEAAARTLDVPRHVVVALAHDDTPVALPVLRSSSLLGEADLVDAVAVGDAEAQAAVASRPGLTDAVAAALTEAAHRDAILVLCRNHAADIAAATLGRIVERFRKDGEMREAILTRPDLDPGLRHDLVVVTARALTDFALACHWMSPGRADWVKRESREKGAVAIAVGSLRRFGPEGPRQLAAHLQARGHLTPALLLRALLSGNLALFEAALSLLAGVATARVRGHLRAPMSLGFASLYAKAAMPPALLPVFCAALEAALRHGSNAADERPALLRPAVTYVLDVCARSDSPELARVAALLRRFEVESLREGLPAARPQCREAEDGYAPEIAVWMMPQTTAPVRLPLLSAA